ncbi:MAG: hypothetical protein NXH88_07395 [Hyphomonas sp.]|nr:hypothetical protein [Hyphomonas sp.]
MVRQTAHKTRSPKAKPAATGRHDPALVAVAKYLARWAAERDYDEHRKNMETARAAAAPKEPDS